MTKPKLTLSKPKWRRADKYSVVREMPEATLPYEDLWEQHLTLIGKVE